MVDAAELGGWVRWTSHFPPAPGLPGDALEPGSNPFTIRSYLAHVAALLKTLLMDLQTCAPVVPAATAARATRRPDVRRRQRALQVGNHRPRAGHLVGSVRFGSSSPTGA